MTRGGRLAARALATLGVVALASCNSETVIATMPLDLLIGSGDGQFGVVGSQLPNPLRVAVQSATTGQPRAGVTVLWDVTEGGAALVGVTTTVTDSTGSTEIRVRLGATPGPVGVRARIADQPNVAVEFRLVGVSQPTLSSLAPSSVAAGDTITLSGANFSPVSAQNVVLFSGIRGRVVAATSTSLDVVVPRCLPAIGVEVHMQLGIVASADTLPLSITGGSLLTPLRVGDVIDVADDGGFECYALEGGAGVSYLTVVYSASTVGAVRYPYRLTALASQGALPTPEPAQAPDLRVAAAQPPADPQSAWELHLRELEGELIRGGARRADEVQGPAGVGPAAAPPVLGDRRTFTVLNAQGTFDTVGAVARWVGSQGAIFVDTLAPAGGFNEAELAAFAARFDQVIHPEVTSAFGDASDLDGNGRVVILMTPVVNRMTPRGSSGFIGGFFYGLDLLPTRTGSNAGEIFYALVPDPTGIHSDARSKAQVTRVVPAILAHEFQHMVHFNERVLKRGASQESVWLSEALAQMAEELVARAYDGVDAFAADTLFRDGTRVRSRRYLQRTDTVSVIVATGQGSLPERGAGFLNMLYVDDRIGGDILGRLTRTTRTGVANVEAESGLRWPDLVGDWWSALYLDQLAAGVGPMAYPTVDLRSFLGNPFPLTPTLIDLAGLDRAGALWSSSASYFVVMPGQGETTTIRLGGEAGGPSAAQAVLRMRIVRVS